MPYRRITVVILSSLIFIIAVIVQLSLSTSNPSALQKPLVTNLLFGVLGLAAILASLFFWLLPPSSNKAKQKGETKSIGIRVNILDGSSSQLEDLNKEQRGKEQELLNATKQELALDRERFNLEQERQVIGWQKEALSLVSISPRAAILIAWIGVEQELERVNTTLGLSEGSSRISGSPLVIMDYLLHYGYINKEEVNTLRQMRSIRNQVVHGLEEKEITVGQAIDFVQDATNITQKLASLEKQQPPTEESIS